MIPDIAAEVVRQDDLGAGVFRIRLLAPEIAGVMRPGQFVMITCAPTGGPILRRPFSIQRATDGQIDLLYRVVGLGTRSLSALRPGARIATLGPLGRPFDPPGDGERAVLIGGGVGIPPMVALAHSLDAVGLRSWQAFLGVRGATDAGCWVGFDEGFDSDERVHHATLDGSRGWKGHALASWLSSEGAHVGRAPVRVYACGPMAMLRAVAEACATRGIPCQVSVETMMGCGVGICMGCVVESKSYVEADPGTRKALSPYDRWWLACRKGPVFDAATVVLDDGGLLH